jgi:type IX secretion system PorP/SprF family membrane protein
MKKTILIFYLVFATFLSTAQDVNFTMANQNLIYYNPAFTGSTKNFRFSYTYRNENLSYSSLITHYVSADQYTGKIGGVGLSYLRDVQLDYLTTNIISLNYAKSISLGKIGCLSMGASGSLYQEQMDWNKVTFGDYINTRRGFIYNSNSISIEKSKDNEFDFNLGLLFYTNKFYIGYAAHHITQPDVNLIQGSSPLSKSHNVQIGYKIIINENLEVLPAITASLQNNFLSIRAYLQMKWKWVIFGLGYGNYIKTGMLGLSYDKWRLFYSYDNYVSKLTNQEYGSHQISLQLNLNLTKKENTIPFSIY